MASSANKQTVEDTTVQQLNDLFGSVLNLDIIKTVASSCQYDVTKSSNKLLEITSYSNGKEFINKLERNHSVNSLIPRSNSNNSLELPYKSKSSSDIDRTVSFIQQGYKVLVLMRGLPGSGKSTLARQILESTIGYDKNYSMHILSTDDYFYQNKQGIYKYDVAKIGEAHNWNQSRAFQAMSRGFSPVIIDNTNVKMWELKPYATMATDYGYIIEILEPNTPWCFSEKELSKRNNHSVRREKIKDMLLSYERSVTPRKLLNDYNLVYKLQKPPQIRLYPPLNTSIVPLPSITPVTDSSNYQANVKNVQSSKLNIPVTNKSTIETINLMEFDDDVSPISPPLRMTTADLCQELNAPRNILMCKDFANINHLEPQQNENAVIVVIDSSDDEVMPVPRFSDIEKAWGINEKSLRSWDIVTPLSEGKDLGKKMPKLKNVVEEVKIETSDRSCITEDKYFRLLKYSDIETRSIDGICIISTVNRDINRFSKNQDTPVLKKTYKSLLDKSCMTEDVYENYDNHMTYLINMFPDVPQNHLKYWYNKCKGDLEWTIEFLLEGKEEISSLIEDTEDTCPEQNGKSKQDEGDSDSSNSNEQKKKRKYNRSPGDHEDLKSMIESKIDINSEHYSKNLLRIKYGLNSLVDKPSTSIDCSVDNKSSGSKGIVSVNTDDIIDVDLDMGFDDVDLQENCDKPDQVVEDTIELNLGNNFVMQLEKQFGGIDMSYPKGCQPVVQVPVSLARQLYMFYIESVYQQMDNQMQILDTLTKQDEEFARKLQDEEENGTSDHAKPMNFSEIMEEQKAQCIYQKEVDKWKNLNPDNLAAKLTREKLFRVFPSIDRDTLVEILYAHDNNYKSTVESLLASTGTEQLIHNIETIKEPPIGEDVILEMKEAQKANSVEESEDLHEATHYREEASKCLKRRDDLYNKAQLYYQRGIKEVAQFYSGLASKQTVYFEKANFLAVTAFLDEHSKRLQDFNTLDLHFLYVKEAIIALDMFLDKNINLLRLSMTKHSEYLQIITGRGNRSENGISRIRPAVQARLKIRKVKFIQMNPGLLKVKILKNSLVTSELSL